MKKRRIASTRNMNKQEKRRLQLNKRQGTNVNSMNKKRMRASFARPAGSRQVLSNDNTTVKAPLNKRIIALILAIVIIAGLIPAGLFIFKPKAEETNKAMEPVVMSVRVNGVDTGKQAVVKAGEITPSNINLGDFQLPEGVSYVKAVVYDSETGSETPIYSVGQKNNTDYYSIKQNSYTGVAKNDNDTLILDYANKYILTFNGTESNKTFTVPGEGTYTTNATKDLDNDVWFIYGGEDLVIKEITPAQDRETSRVTFTSAKSSGTERVKNSEATISSDMLTGDTNVTVTFNEVTRYTIQDARYMSSSKYYSQYYGLDNHGGTSQSLEARSKTNSLTSKNPGETAEFYVYSQKNTTNKEQWKLSMLSLNGVDLKFPADGASPGTSVDTPFDNNRNVRVTYISDTETFGESGNRTAYKISLENVHENLEVNYYFTNIKERKLIVKGLNGINKTAASVENYILTGDLYGKWYTYTSNKQNVYDAFYDRRTNYPADNLVLYTVKPGYNPYAITTSMFNGTNGQAIDIRATDVTGLPEDVIEAAGYGSTGNFNTDWRHWGRNSGKLENNEDTYGFPKKQELVLTTIAKDVANTWYAVALAQDTSMNQQLYLNAPMYPYAFAFDLDSQDATLDGTYAEDGDYLVDSNNPHFIDGNNTYGYLPSTAPTRRGYEFIGWVMLDSEGNMLNEQEYTFQPSDRIDINEETVSYASNAVDNKSTNNSVVQQIRFIAKWNKLKAADTDVSITTKVQNGYSDGIKTYDTIVNHAVEQQIAGDTALLNDRSNVMGDKHYVINSESEIVKTTNEDGTNNDFVAIYDYNLLDYTVKNTVLGYPKTQRFEITVTLKKSDDSPVDIALGQNLISAKVNDEEQTVLTPEVDTTAGTLTYTLNLLRDQQVMFENVPYGWTYTVAEDAKENDYTREISSENGSVEKDMVVEVTNMSDNSELHTTKKITFNEETGKYDLKLEAWATGDKISKYDKEPVPTDIALVIDQSGSMATTDMNPTYTEVKSGNNNKTSWTVSEATSGKQYYVKVNGKYYPVHAGEGTLYENVGRLKTYQLIGSGHNDFSLGLNGAPTYFNIASNYYYPDSTGKMRHVFSISAGGFGSFYTYQYIYNSDDVENYYLNPTTKTGLSGELRASDWNRRNEWRDQVYWFFIGFPWKTTRLGQNKEWDYLRQNNLFEWVGTHSSSDSSGDNVRNDWSWLGTNDTLDYDLYQVKDGTNYNHLYYVNDQGNHVQFSSSANLESDVVYNGVLYETTGESRVYALQDAVKEFVEMVADNAATNNVDHRISMIGFAGNKTPALSTTNGVWHASPDGYNNYYDYVNTGVFLEGNFQNYQTITSFSQASTAYINWHYYANNNDSYAYNKISYGSNQLAPVLHNGSAWKFLGTSTTASGTKYEPTYTPISDQQYLNSLASVSPSTNAEVTDDNGLAKDTNSGSFVINTGDNNGVNDYLDTAITQFGSYGGTYTSYGMAMANRVLTLAKAADTTNKRQRVIVVFTDGEPGANGYDSAIANEALFDSNDSKDADSLNAKVYTVGLYPGNVSSTVESFMKKLSSEYSNAETTKVYSGAKDGVASTLDNTKTYYFKDPVENKTFALSAMKNGTSTLGWWSKTGTDASGYTYSKYEPMTASDEWDSSGYNSNTGSYAFFSTESGSRRRSDVVYADDLVLTQTYYLNNGTPVNYENRWYDSNNRIRDPLRYEGDTEGAGNRYQFYEMGNSTESGDGETYYYAANNADALKEAFAQISDSMVKSTASLDGSNSMLRDVVTGKFANVSNNDVKVYTVEGTLVNPATNEIKWATKENNPSEEALVEANYNKDVKVDPSNNEQSIIEVQGFDYSTEYIAQGHNDGKGKKLVVTISNLEPEALGYELESNTNDSGIIELTKDEDNNTVENLLYPFEIPKINRYQHNLKVEGVDTETNYGMKLKLTPKNDGGSVPESVTVHYRIAEKEEDALEMHHIYNPDSHTLTFNNGVATWPSDASAPSFSSIILEDLDDKYVISAIVDEPDASKPFDYSLALDNKSSPPVFGTAYELNREKTQTTQIDSKQKMADVTIREITSKTHESTASYADPDKPFTIQLTLKNGNDAVEGTFDGLTFDENGHAELVMKHEQQRTFSLPVGYTLDVDVKADDQVDTYGTYVDTYAPNLTAKDDADTDSANAYTVNIASAGNQITVVNSIGEKAPPTGILDGIQHMNPFIWLAIALCMIAATGFAVYDRRRRKREEL